MNKYETCGVLLTIIANSSIRITAEWIPVALARYAIAEVPLRWNIDSGITTHTILKVNQKFFEIMSSRWLYEWKQVSK